ncbi:unnamed protein product [Prunus armeniaca]
MAKTLSGNSSGYLALGLASSCPGWMSLLQPILGDKDKEPFAWARLLESIRLKKILSEPNIFLPLMPRDQESNVGLSAIALSLVSQCPRLLVFCRRSVTVLYSDVVYQVLFSPLELSR